LHDIPHVQAAKSDINFAADGKNIHSIVFIVKKFCLKNISQKKCMEKPENSRRTVLVTGGAGYVGSHVVLQLVDSGFQVVVLDNLSTGSAKAVLNAKLVIGDAGDSELVSSILSLHNIDTVLHFAASTIVSESITDPLLYYKNNTCVTRNLLSSCLAKNVRHIIFSSTASVYGSPALGIADEETPTIPMHPYGTSKLMSEWMLLDLAKVSNLSHVTLRYFNVAGCNADGRAGHIARNSTLLIKAVCEAAVGNRQCVEIFGTKLNTPDGTGVRDYIHVDDLASAHLGALRYLYAGGKSTTLNCGYGKGYSVLEVLRSIENVSGHKVETIEGAPRRGDPPMLIGDTRKIRQVLDWSPRYDHLDMIVESSFAWEKRCVEENNQARKSILHD
jgi:UDP-glucose 4-epimerase